MVNSDNGSSSCVEGSESGFEQGTRALFSILYRSVMVELLIIGKLIYEYSRGGLEGFGPRQVFAIFDCSMRKESTPDQ